MTRVLVAEKISEKGVQLLRDNGIETDYMPKITREELLKIIDQYDGLIVRSVPIVDEELYQYGKNLKAVGRAGNGIDNIDLDGATKRGIVILNTPDANSVSACELTIGMMLSSSRYIIQANNLIKSGTWGRSQFQGSEMLGKTLGIVGLGRIGTMVAQRMNSFGMKVIAYDPYIPDSKFQKAHVEKRETLDDLIRESDILTVHTPKTEETFGMIGKEQFKLAKPGLRVVNCARGGIVNEKALYEAMQEGIVASAACDVMVEEPCLNAPLYKLDNFIVTPHIGATTDEAQENVGISVAQEVVDALRGDMVPNAVNLPTLKKEELEEIQPYLRLGENLGKFYYQLQKAPAEQLTVEYFGTVAQMDTDVLTLAVIKGLLEPTLEEKINFVNARLVAEERGLKFATATQSQVEHFQNLIRVKVTAGKKEYVYSGTVFTNGEIRLVEVEGFTFDMLFAPNMLVIENSDTPGMIGSIGTVLGKEAINIATMQVSRKEHNGNYAMMVLTVDSPVAQKALDHVEETKGINKVRFVKL